MRPLRRGATVTEHQGTTDMPRTNDKRAGDKDETRYYLHVKQGRFRLWTDAEGVEKTAREYAAKLGAKGYYVTEEARRVLYRVSGPV